MSARQAPWQEKRCIDTTNRAKVAPSGGPRARAPQVACPVALISDPPPTLSKRRTWKPWRRRRYLGPCLTPPAHAPTPHARPTAQRTVLIAGVCDGIGATAGSQPARSGNFLLMQSLVRPDSDESEVARPDPTERALPQTQSLTVLADDAIFRPLLSRQRSMQCRRSPSRICPRPIAWLNGGAGSSVYGEGYFIEHTARSRPSRV